MQCIPTFTFFFFFLFLRGEEGAKSRETNLNLFRILFYTLECNNNSEWFFLMTTIYFFSLIVLDIAENYFGRSNEDALNRGFDDDSVTLRFVDCDARMQFQS